MARRRKDPDNQASEDQVGPPPDVIAAPEQDLEADQEPEIVVVDADEDDDDSRDGDHDVDAGFGDDDHERPDFGEGAGAQLRMALYDRGRRFLDLLTSAQDELTPAVVHQLRVTGRRLEAALGLMGALIGRAPVTKLRRRLKEVRRSLGDLRDLQRQLEAVAEEPLLDEYLTERSGHLPKTISKCRKVLRKVRTRKLEKGLEMVDALVAALLQEDGEENAQALLHRAIWETLLRAMAQAEEVDPDHSFSYHPLRIALKRFRYEAEIYAAAGWPIALDRHDGWDKLKELHQALGALQDNEVLWCHLDLHWVQTPPVRESQVRLVNRMMKERNQALGRIHLQDLDWEQLWEWPEQHSEELPEEDEGSEEAGSEE
jgi:CHAD domain-containing protein